MKLHPAKGIRYHGAVDRFSWMTRPPADGITAQATLREDIPKALHLREVLV